MKSIPLQEIRIGNLAYGLYEDENGKQQKNVCKFLAIDSTGSLGDGWWALVEKIEGGKTNEYDDTNEYEDFFPIPLTEDWHKRFGVSKNAFGSFEYLLPEGSINFGVKVIFNGDYVFIQQGRNIPDADIISIWNKDLTKRDMFVHEWQNFYHILSGEELTMNL